MKFDSTLMTLVKNDLISNNIPMLLGEPGIGKSSWVEDLAREFNTECFILACNQLADKADLTGARLMPTKKEKTYKVKQDDGTYKDTSEIIDTYVQDFFPHAVIDQAVDYALNHPTEYPILFLDELNRTTPDVTSEALSIPTMRRIGNTKLPDNLRVIIAGNDKGNVTSLDEASISRFVLYHVTPDVNTFLGLDPNLNVFVERALKAHPEAIFGKSVQVVATKVDDDSEDTQLQYIEDTWGEGEKMEQIATPRTIAGVSRFLNKLMENGNQLLIQMLANTYQDEDGAPTNALQEAIVGHTGNTAFTAALMNEIATGIQSASSSSKAVNNLPKPVVYEQMLKCPDMTTLNSYVASLPDKDKSACLVYALWEKEDRSDIVTAIAPQLKSFEPADTANFMKYLGAGEMNQDNIHAFVAGASPLAAQVTPVINMYSGV